MQRSYTYTIDTDENGNLEIWMKDGINETPFIHQPFNPDGGQPWTDEAEAKAWADEQVSAMSFRDANPQPEPIDPSDYIRQAQEDSERIKNLETTMAEILKKLS